MIFISYSWEDQIAVREIEERLRYIGVRYWIDRKNLDLKKCLKLQIKQALLRSDYVLFLDSKASQLSPWVKFEKKIANRFGKEVVEYDLYKSRIEIADCIKECRRPSHIRLTSIFNSGFNLIKC